MFKRLASPFRQFGFWAGLLYVVARGLQVLSPRLNLFFYDLVVQPVPASPSLNEIVDRAIEIRRIEPGDPEVALMPARPEIKASRFEQGAVCLGAFRKGAFVGYIWLASGAYEEDEVRCTYIPAPHGQAVFDFDLYIFPPYRMGRSFSGLWRAVNETLHAHGVRWSFSRITRFNTASRRAHARLGARSIGRALFLQAWRLELMTATIRPFFSLTVSGRVKLPLGPAAESATSATPPAPDDSGSHAG